MADFTAAGDHAGFLPRMRAPKPATWGEAMDVPDMNPNLSPPAPIGETPARMATPGAATSGFSRSESVAISGPREEKPANWGCASAGSPVVSLLTRETVMAGVAANWGLSVSVAGGLAGTVGTECLSASSDDGGRLTRIIPTPPP